MHKAVSISAAIAFILGIISIIAGSRVLLNFSDPGYNVLPWLVYYNVLLGAVSIVTAYLIWKLIKPALQVSAVIASLHILVLMLLNTVFFTEVARQSINAMMFRAFVWIIILYVLKRSKAF